MYESPKKAGPYIFNRHKIKDTRGGTDTYIDYAKAFIDYVADKKSITIPTTTNVKYDFNK